MISNTYQTTAVVGLAAFAFGFSFGRLSPTRGAAEKRKEDPPSSSETSYTTSNANASAQSSNDNVSLNLATLSPDILCQICQYLPLKSLYKSIPLIHPHLKSALPTLHHLRGGELTHATEPNGCADLQPYLRLPGGGGGGGASRMLVKWRWKDQGWGNRKGRLGMSILRVRGSSASNSNVVDNNDEEVIIHHSFTPKEYPSPHDWEDVTYEVPADVMQFCGRHDVIQIWRFAGGGHGHVLKVMNFNVWYWDQGSVAPSSPSSSINSTISDLDDELQRAREISWPPVGTNPALVFHSDYQSTTTRRNPMRPRTDAAVQRARMNRALVRVNLRAGQRRG
ncbi:predicted protein [Thalassiosira pseudonana CCMP1335]|uniref:F-box domain-containing protein n=1 Tax=Thalassiosira pseudonana TaxID=35128 RepID=B5YP22_THAPS|nr:predicted protein [Thalassiosira pseudonana CCMP1335]ACI64379.1 predicted protein [Thalassiosira pseudonana CCMP1335]